jgi:hypothetical protein
MIGWEPRQTGLWHLSRGKAATSLCGVLVAGIGRYVQRDPHKIDHYEGTRCPTCWMEWKLLGAASYAKQDQHEASRSPSTRREGE